MPLSPNMTALVGLDWSSHDASKLFSLDGPVSPTHPPLIAGELSSGPKEERKDSTWGGRSQVGVKVRVSRIQAVSY